MGLVHGSERHQRLEVAARAPDGVGYGRNRIPFSDTSSLELAPSQSSIYSLSLWFVVLALLMLGELFVHVLYVITVVVLTYSTTESLVYVLPVKLRPL